MDAATPPVKAVSIVEDRSGDPSHSHRRGEDNHRSRLWHEDDGGIVLGDENDLRIRILNDDLLAVFGHLHFLRAHKVSRVLGLAAQGLHCVHQLGLLKLHCPCEGITPVGVVGQHRQSAVEACDDLDGKIPGLTGDFVFRVGSRVLPKKCFGLVQLVRECG
jgi:hypothetical protein